MELFAELPLDLQTHILHFIPSYVYTFTDEWLRWMKTQRAYRSIGIEKGIVTPGPCQGTFMFHLNYTFASRFYFQKTVYFGSLQGMSNLPPFLPYDIRWEEFVLFSSQTYVHEGLLSSVLLS